MNVEKSSAVPVMIALLAISSIYSSGVKAEQGCPDGFVPNAAPTGIPGQNQCIPGPPQGYGSGNGYSSGASHHDGHGAFAFDPAAMAVGASDIQTAFARSWQAKWSALRSCKKNGGTDCKIIATFENECAAAVLGATDSSNAKVTIYVGKGQSIDDAQGDAEQRCKAAGSPVCKAAYSDCAMPWQD
jgi:hypothetical protein